MAQESDGAGVFSALATYALLAVVAVKTGAINTVTHELPMLFMGKIGEVARNHTTFLMMFPIMCATVVLELPSSILSGILQRIILGKSSRHASSDFLNEMKEGNHFFEFFLLVLLEELYARWLFLGLLTKISFLSGSTAFYLLFFIGNGTWALAHLRNFKKKKDRRILRVLPQFIAGFFLTYIFVKYGLLAVILTHFASNAVIFALHKVQRIGMVDALIVGYAALSGMVSYAFMRKPLTDILAWFADKPTFAIPGWAFWDYLKVSIFITACFLVLSGCLLYDRSGETEKDPKKKTGFLESMSYMPLGIGIIYGAYWLLGFAVANVPYRVLLLAILCAFLQKAKSGSATSRIFWLTLPDIYVTICIMQALGFWASTGWIIAETIIQAPQKALAEIDD